MCKWSKNRRKRERCSNKNFKHLPSTFIPWSFLSRRNLPLFRTNTMDMEKISLIPVLCTVSLSPHLRTSILLFEWFRPFGRPSGQYLRKNFFNFAKVSYFWGYIFWCFRRQKSKKVIKLYICALKSEKNVNFGFKLHFWGHHRLKLKFSNLRVGKSNCI